MAGYILEARRHVKKIEYYYKNAGTRGYSQALYHFDELASLVRKAQNSKKYRGEASFLHSLMKSKQEMMDEMKLRGKDSDNK